MRNLSSDLLASINNPYSKDVWLYLLEITLNNEEETIHRLVNNNENIIFEGNTYTAFNFEIEPLIQSAEGILPTRVLRVSNITRIIQSYLKELNGGIGSTVRVVIINTNFLADNYADLDETYDVTSCSTDVKFVEFTLGSPSLLRRRMPLYRYIAENCPWQFDTTENPGVECNYREDGSVPGFTSCGRTLADCRERGNEDNFGGCLGLKTGALKVV